MELEVFIHLVDIGKDIAHNPRDDALHLWVSKHTLHCMGFTRRGLTVGKNGAIVPAQYICKKINSILCIN